MLSVLSPSNLSFLNSLNQTQAQLNKVESELSSGLAVNQASDAPDQVSAILQLHANIQQNQQLTQNLTQIQGLAQTADSSLGTGITLLDQVMSIATEGLGTQATASTRQTAAVQITGLLQQMVGISNTAVDGQYIFSGSNTGSPSYQYDANSASGVDRLQISTSTQQAQDGSGQMFSIALTANEIFDQRDGSDKPTSNNVFAAINAVRVALQNNDSTGLQAALGSVQTASSYLNSQQSFYGNVENRLTTALSDASSQSISLQSDLSNREDADETQAIVQMQQYSTTLQAAIAAEAKMPTTTLFNDLPS